MHSEQTAASTDLQRAFTGTQELRIRPGFQDLKTTLEELTILTAHRHALEFSSFHELPKNEINSWKKRPAERRWAFAAILCASAPAGPHSSRELGNKIKHGKQPTAL